MKPIIAILLIASFASLSHSLPLSRSSRWIIDDESGERVKLACANWPGHLKPMLPEGLDRRPLSEIASHVSHMGFNCVRITWATYMFTRHANVTVAKSFGDLGLNESIAGLAQHNPDLLSLSLVDAHKAVIEEVGRHGIMMVLDNQVSEPMWCCANNDGNGFFGDKYFDPKEWLQGLATVASLYKDTPMVVGISLRNELRGPLQNESVWYKNVEKGAKTLNRANPNLLVIISGLDYDLDFRFLKQKPLGLNMMRKKMVYETHRYAFSEGQSKMWEAGPLNKVCYNITQEMEDKEGFLLIGKDAAPLFVSEFGIDQREVSEPDNLHLPCILAYLADKDLDWAVWALQGSYYFREGKRGMEETFGMFNGNWTALRNPTFHSKLEFLQTKLQDPGSSEATYYLLYHPLSGKCARVDSGRLHMSDCLGASRWAHGADGMPIHLLGTSTCLAAERDGHPATLSGDCMNEGSTWNLASMLQLANKGDDGVELCLDYDSSYSSSLILTRKCVGLQEGDMRNPQTQWFKLIAANVK
ncbi:glycosyl hydrolase 5 family protein-like [Ipomoea triloba]|uniref:glycosyl hydrolase 5 family protein-like n=1 Tax=Ipomoea triloba TaxID=35885 RepID=UPI00125E1AD8|nr:glycosyl hydrolase 5 family protein-like [Ipomoea triloba]